MKSLMIAFLVVLSASISACGKKSKGGGGGVAAAPAPGPGPTGGPLCTGGMNCINNVPVNTWKGYISVSNPAQYQKFLQDYGYCQQWGGWSPNQCQTTNQPLYVAVRTARDPYRPNSAMLPGPVGFIVGQLSSSRGQGNLYQGGNGFEVAYDQYNTLPFPHQFPNQYPYPYPQPNLNNGLRIALTMAGPYQNVLNAVVYYQNIQLGSGPINAQYPIYQQTAPNQNPGGAPTTLPFRQ